MDTSRKGYQMIVFCIIYVFITAFDSARSCSVIEDCHCFENTQEQLSYHCVGDSIANVTRNLPVGTISLTYTALEPQVDIVTANLSRLTNLQTLHILPAPNISLYQRIKELQTADRYVLPTGTLRELVINVPWELQAPLPFLLKGMNRLEHLDLSNTRFMNISNLIVTMSSLQGNTYLTYLNLWNIQTFEFADPSLQFDLASLLAPLAGSKLSYLNIGYNALRQVHPVGLLRFAPHLQQIIVSNNMLIPLITSALYLEIIMHPSIEIVHMSQQMYRPSRQKKSIINDPIGISGQDRCVLLQDTPEMKYYRQLFSTNHTAFCVYLYQTDIQLFGGVPCDMIPPLQEFVKEGCSGCAVVPLTGTIKELYISQLNVYDEVVLHPGYRTKPNCFYPNNSLHILDLSNNHDFGWIGITDAVKTEVLGFEGIKRLDVSNCGIVNLNPYLLNNFPLLEFLDISHNFLTAANDSLLINSLILQVLNLSYNEIQILDDKFLIRSYKLEILNLSYNRIAGFQPDVSNLYRLRALDLTGNRISMFGGALINQLNSLVTNTSFSISLLDNPLTCTCNSEAFIRWTQQYPTGITLLSKEKYLCTNKDSRPELLKDVSLHRIKEECNILNKYIIISVASTLAVVLLLAIAIVAYKKRWKIRYLMFLAKTMWNNKIHSEYGRFKYDAFISYNVEDRFWVHDMLRPNMENKKGLKLCLHFRDFLPGDIIEDQVHDAISQSNKTVLVLSPNFLKSRWCFFELQMARNRLIQQGVNLIILVILSPLPLANIPRTLANLMEENVYLEWTPDPDGQKIFWHKLEEAIRTPRKQTLPV